MRCETCQGVGMKLKITKTGQDSWWRGVLANREKMWAPIYGHWEYYDRWEYVPCPDCIGGISSCCDTAGASQAHILDAAEPVDSGDKI